MRDDKQGTGPKSSRAEQKYGTDFTLNHQHRSTDAIFQYHPRELASRGNWEYRSHG
jgi:hypothetical protein